MELPVLYRKRFIPLETVRLKDDEILSFSEEFIITKWKTLKPRKDFSHGLSLYMLKEGLKISKFFTGDNELLYIYCDIIDVYYNEKANEYIISDLLADVIVYNDNSVKVVDIGEIPEAFDKGLIDINLVKTALARLDILLNIIYSGRLLELLERFSGFQ